MRSPRTRNTLSAKIFRRRHPCPRFIRAAALLALFCVIASRSHAAEFTVEQKDDRVTVMFDGELFTEYLVKSGRQPILWPIIGPTGQPMTRQYPMKEVGEHERADHKHHRSMWCTHGDVNGYDFWAEHGDDAGHMPAIQHREFAKVEADGDTATIVTKNDWLDPAGKRICQDTRTLVFGARGESRWIDFTIDVDASDGDVVFGDTKEGSFAVRVPGTMKVDAKMGGKIINSNGQTDGDAWARSAEWVDYHGPVAGEQVGIAMFSHPSNFRHPCRWHVRTYGLFAANPFGQRDFAEVPGDEQGAITIPAGETGSLRYRVLFHKGDEKEADIAGAFAEFAKD